MCLEDGYAYEFKGKRRWRAAADDNWEIVMQGGDDQAVPRGQRYIDGSLCNVFLCNDGKLRAQVAR